METLDDKIMPELCPRFSCKYCDYNTDKKSSYDNHIVSNRHKRITNGLQMGQNYAQIMPETFICTCGKQYKHRQGLWKHKKKCTNITIQDLANEEKQQQLIEYLLKENSEFKQLMIDQHNQMLEQNKHMIEMAKNAGHNTNNSHNTTNNNQSFNLQFFLNEQCKDALNLSDFVSSVTMELSDLEETGRLGYVEGVSRIINKNLNKLDVYKRPIHCSDLKRETLYIKNDDEWKKEGDGNSVIIKAIKDVANENIKQIGEWRKEHPGCSEADSNKNDMYLKIVSNAMSGATREEQMTNYEKIVSKIAKEVVIVK